MRNLLAVSVMIVCCSVSLWAAPVSAQSGCGSSWSGEAECQFSVEGTHLQLSGEAYAAADEIAQVFVTVTDPFGFFLLVRFYGPPCNGAGPGYASCHVEIPLPIDMKPSGPFTCAVSGHSSGSYYCATR